MTPKKINNKKTKIKNTVSFIEYEEIAITVWGIISKEKHWVLNKNFFIYNSIISKNRQKINIYIYITAHSVMQTECKKQIFLISQKTKQLWMKDMQ